MTRFFGIVLVVGLIALTGCKSVPPGYRYVEAVVKPEGRPVGFMPFLPKYRGVTLVDGIKLGELAAVELRRKLPKLEVYGPSDMQKALAAGMDESRWVAIGRDAGVELLVIGEITSLECFHDELVQTREGRIGFRFRVLDVSGEAPKRVARVNWQFGFPENPADKFDTSYVEMDAATFRNEVIKTGAKRISESFYDHLVKDDAVSRMEVRSYKD